MIKGSCYCGAVRFGLMRQPGMMGTCHCSRCRKAGSSTIVFVNREDLVWIEGREHVTLHQPPAPYVYGRCFCGICGTALGEILSDAASFPISAHAIDDPLEVRNSLHEFIEEKPDWCVIRDDAGTAAHSAG